MSRRRAIIIGLLVAATLGSAYLTAQERPVAGPFEREFRDALAPVQYALSQGYYRLRQGVDSVLSLGRAERESRQLRRTLARLRTENAALVAAKRENDRWRRLLAFRDTSPYQMVVAQVIGRDPSNWYGNIIIDKGRTSGLKKDMAVITEDGVVGLIRQVSDRSSLVLLMTDSKSAIGGQIADTRDFVLVEGSAEVPGAAVVKPLGAEVRLKVGQEISTSGLGILFPKGLRIGRIERIVKGRYGLAASGVLRPVVNLSRLEEVSVIVNAPPAPQEPLVDTGEANPSASP